MANSTLARVGLAKGLHRFICLPPQHFAYPHGCATAVEVCFSGGFLVLPSFNIPSQARLLGC